MARKKGNARPLQYISLSGYVTVPLRLAAERKNDHHKDATLRPVSALTQVWDKSRGNVGTRSDTSIKLKSFSRDWAPPASVTEL